MSLTAQAIARECLAYLGEFNLDTFTSFGTARTAILARIARDINAGLQGIYRERSDLFRQRPGLAVPAPETQTVGVTQGSATITIGTPYATTLAGQTCNVGGVWTEVSGTTLLNKWTGASGSVSMTVYGDSAPLDAGFVRVLGNMTRDGNVPLSPIANRAQFNAAGCYGWGDSDYGRPLRPSSGSFPHRIDSPAAWWVEPVASTTFALRLRVAPLPDRAYSLAYDAEVKPAAITTANFGSESTDPGVTFPLPGDMAESLLLPLVLQSWSGSPWFKDAEHRAEIARRAADAQRQLSNFRTQGQGGSRLVTSGYA